MHHYVALKSQLLLNNLQILRKTQCLSHCENSTVKLENSQYNPFILFSKVVVQHSIYNTIEAAVEVCHEVARREEPLGYGLTQSGVDRHRQAYKVQRSPADGEQHKHHKHGEKVPEVMRFDLGPTVRLDPLAHLYDEDPNAQVAVCNDADGQDEVHHNYRDGVERAHRLGEGARVDARVVLQRLHEPVWDDCQDCQCPDQDDVAYCVLVGEELVVLKAVADVTVAVDGDTGDVENRADHTEPHEEAADLTVNIASDPAVMEDGGQNERVGVDGHHQICYCQTHHKGITCQDKREEDHSKHCVQVFHVELRCVIWRYFINADKKKYWEMKPFP